MPVYLDERAPRFYLGHVLHEDDARRNARHCPPQHYPRQPAYFLIDGLAAFGAGEVLTIGRKPRYTDRAPARNLFGINGEHVLLKVKRVRVIDLVHGDCVRVVIDRYIDGIAERKLHARACASAAREVIHDKLSEQIILKHLYPPFFPLFRISRRQSTCNPRSRLGTARDTSFFAERAAELLILA